MESTFDSMFPPIVDPDSQEAATTRMGSVPYAGDVNMTERATEYISFLAQLDDDAVSKNMMEANSSFSTTHTSPPGLSHSPASPFSGSGSDYAAAWSGMESPQFLFSMDGEARADQQASDTFDMSSASDDAAPFNFASDKNANIRVGGGSPHVKREDGSGDFYRNCYEGQNDFDVDCKKKRRLSSSATESLAGYNGTSAVSEQSASPVSRKDSPSRPIVGPVGRPRRDAEIPRHEKVSHNVIERKYRLNINDKITALRDAVPTLRYARHIKNEDEMGSDDLDGLERASKLSKAMILFKATEYIHHLEARVEEYKLSSERLVHKNEALRRKLAEAELQLQNQAANTPRTRTNIGPRTIAGGMAAIMAVNGMREHGGHDGGFMHQMSAIPFVARAATFVRDTQQAATSHLSKVASFTMTEEYQALFALKVMLFVGIVLYVIFPSLHRLVLAPASSSGKQSVVQQDGIVGAIDKTASSLDSPQAVRRETFAAASRGLQLPQDRILCKPTLLKLSKLMLRYAVGGEGFRLIRGASENDDLVRRTTWQTVVSSQLCGGDSKLNDARLFHTFLAGLSLPETALGFLLASVHVRLLTCDGRFSEKRSLQAADYFWKLARNAKDKDSVDKRAFPDRWAYLVDKFSPKEVMNADIMRMLKCLAYKKTQRDSVGNSSTLIYFTRAVRSVEEDPDIQSPIDAIATWYSRQQMAYVIEKALAASASSCRDSVPLTAVDKVAALAPPGSRVYREILLLRSILLPLGTPSRHSALEKSIAAYSHLLPPRQVANSKPRTAATAPDRVLADEQTILKCLMAGELLREGQVELALHVTTGKMTGIFEGSDAANASTILLNLKFLCAMGLCETLVSVLENMESDNSCKNGLMRELNAISNELRVVAGMDRAGEVLRCSTDTHRRLVRRCIEFAKQAHGLSSCTDTVVSVVSDDPSDESGYYSS